MKHTCSNKLSGFSNTRFRYLLFVGRYIVENLFLENGIALEITLHKRFRLCRDLPFYNASEIPINKETLYV